VAINGEGSSDLIRVSAAQGCAAIFDDCKSLKMKPYKNHIFCLARSDHSWMNYSELTEMLAKPDGSGACSK
jgi:hypothetical protein